MCDPFELTLTHSQGLLCHFESGEGPEDRSYHSSVTFLFSPSICWGYGVLVISSSAATQTVPSKSKLVPQLISDLLDLASYSLSCQSTLSTHHKVCGDPVFEGVSAILGRMLLTSDAETRAAFEEIAPTTLGNELLMQFIQRHFIIYR